MAFLFEDRTILVVMPHLSKFIAILALRAPENWVSDYHSSSFRPTRARMGKVSPLVGWGSEDLWTVAEKYPSGTEFSRRII